MFNIEFLKKTFQQAVKFSIVGVFGVSINYSIFILALVQFKIHYIISGLMGYIFAAIPIFFLNRYWTFKSNVAISTGFFVYILINFFTLFCHSLIQYLSKEYFWIPEIYSQACGIFVSTIISFILVRKLMIRKI